MAAVLAGYLGLIGLLSFGIMQSLDQSAPQTAAVQIHRDAQAVEPETASPVATPAVIKANASD